MGRFEKRFGNFSVAFLLESIVAKITWLVVLDALRWAEAPRPKMEIAPLSNLVNFFLLGLVGLTIFMAATFLLLLNARLIWALLCSPFKDEVLPKD